MSPAAWAGEPSSPPPLRLDPAEGVIDGRTAIAFLPLDESDPEHPYFLDPAGCTVHYVPKDDLDAEEVYPCGEWAQPTRGRYFAWLETENWQRTPYVVHGVHSGGPFRGRGMVSAMPLAPAGRVALAQRAPGHSLHLLHLETHLQGEYPQREVWRRVPEAESTRGVLMPEGPVVGLLFDRQKGEYTWVSHPVVIEARKTTRLSPPEPSKGADLWVTLVRSEPVSRFEKLITDLQAGPPGGERPPDVTVPGVYHFYGIWYGLEGSYAHLTASTPTSYLEPVDIPLRPGRVEDFTGNLKPLPKVEAILDLPPELPPAARRLEVLRQGDGRELRRIELAPEAERTVIEALPATRLTIVLQSPPWTLSQRVDLSDGADATVTFAPRPIQLQGTVFLGKEPHPATVTFSTNRAEDELRVDTDAEGHYETVLFRPGVYGIRIDLAGRDGPPFLELTAGEPITESRVLDFHVPANRFEVEITDRQTGEAIGGAEIGFRNRSDQGPTVAMQSRTGDDGIAVLPPLRPGELKLDVQAEGYLPREVEAGRVEALDRDRRLRVTLEPQGPNRRLVLTLPDGRPAAKAEVRQRILGTAGSPWRTSADAAGRLEVPDAVRGSMLFVRHPEAALMIRPWQPGSEEQVHWQLGHAQPPLRVRVLHSWGEPVAFARLALKVDELWLTDGELAWLTSSRSTASRDGQWTAFQLPQSPIELVAWERDAERDLASFASVATRVPWPRTADPIELQAVP